jgi:predicted HNH restriction endonuclease
VYFRVHPNFRRFEVTGLLWFEKLRKRQQSFRYGFNKISDREVITQLERILAGGLSREETIELNSSRYGADLSDIENISTEARIARRGRSRRLRNAALQRAAGICGVCRRDFRTILLGRGVRVLQVHHLSQLSATDAPRITKLNDLAVVCANCHILLRLDSKRALSPSTLRRMLQKVAR